MVGVVATDARLDTAECDWFARAAHAGFARAVRPSHTLFDGDTVFALSTGKLEIGEERDRWLAVLGAVGADCMTRAVARGVHLARRGDGAGEPASHVSP